MLDIRFLESIDNLKGILKNTLRRTPSTTIANQISACLQQGRLFFESATKSSAVIKPIEIYYGALAFSAALHMSKNLVLLATIPQTHGLTIEASKEIESTRVKILEQGSFQLANDVARNYEGLSYFGREMEPLFKTINFAPSSELNNNKITLKEIFSRIPSLSKIYQLTFDQHPDLMPFYMITDQFEDFTSLSIYIKKTYTDKSSLEKIVIELRDKWDFLNEWCFVNADISYGKTELQFANLTKNSLDEFNGDFLIPNDGSSFKAHHSQSNRLIRFDPASKLPPALGGIQRGNMTLVKPINNHYISEYSLFMMGIFILCSIARYQPEHWVNLISYKADKLTAIIEEFMNQCLASIPAMVINILHTNSTSKHYEQKKIHENEPISS